MHVKWNRNLDGIRRPTSPIPGPLQLLSGSGEPDVSEAFDSITCQLTDYKKPAKRLVFSESYLLSANKDDNNNEGLLVNGSGVAASTALVSHHHVIKAEEVEEKATMSRRHSPLSPSNRQANLLSASSYSSTFSSSANRLTSKGALGTLIGLFRFREESAYVHSPKPSKALCHPSRRRLSLERINTRDNFPSVPLRNSSFHRGRRANSLQSLDEVLNSFAELSSPPTRLRPRNEVDSRPGHIKEHNPKKAQPKRHLVKFVNDEPSVMISSLMRPNHIESAIGQSQRPKGILRVRNSPDLPIYSEIVSFRSASSSSPSSSSASSSVSSSKKVHFAQPLLTTYAICGGS